MNRVLRTAVLITVIATFMATMFLVQTNSRSSILIKEMAYVTGSAVALLLFALWLTFNGAFAFDRIGKAIPASFLLLFGWIVLRHFTGITSVNGYDYIYSILAIGGLTLVISCSFSTRMRDVTLWIMVACTFILAAYSILQSMGVIVFSWDAGLTHAARSSGTLGNANLLGSFAMAMIPVGGGFLLSRTRLSKLRYPAAVAFSLFCTGAMLASKTRGSLLGVIVLAALAPFVPFIKRNRKRLALVIAVLVLIVVSSFIFLGSRMEELSNTEAGTLQVRRLIWNGSLDLWLSNPILGYGPGSFQILFPSFRNPSYFDLGVSHNTLHAHCEYLEILGDTGLIGLFLWAILAMMIFRIVRRNGSDIFPCESDSAEDGCGEDDPSSLGSSSGKFSSEWVTLGICGGIIALLAEGFVSVALRWPPSALFLGILVGLLLSCIPFRPGRLRLKTRIPAAVLLTAAALFLLMVAVPDYTRSMRAGRELFMGKDIYLTSISPGAERAIDVAMEWNRTQDGNLEQQAIGYYMSAMDVADSSLKWCRWCVDTDPRMLGGWYALGSAYISTARLYQPMSPPLTAILNRNGIDFEDEERAEEYMRCGLQAYDSLRTMAPDYAEVHNNLALVWINLGNPDSALSHLRRAWDLHAHNRRSYIDKVLILNPLTRSLDGVYLKWLQNYASISRMVEGERPLSVDMDITRAILFDYGCTFIRFPDLADSLNASLDSSLALLDASQVGILVRLTDLQAERMEEGFQLAEELASGDTAGVMRRLEELDPEELEFLPLHSLIYGYILTERGNLHGMEILERNLEQIVWSGIDEVADLPVDIGDMYEALSNSLLATGLETQEEKELFLRNLVNMLKMDRSIFELITFAQSSPILEGNVTDELTAYREVWERIGGPMYTFMKCRDSGMEIPVFYPTSILDSSYSGIAEIAQEDSLDSEMILFDIEWLYVTFCNSYSGIPHYSSQQIEALVCHMADARGRLADLLGEDETQYALGWMFSQLNESYLLSIMADFDHYTEALRSDLTMGRINSADLP